MPIETENASLRIEINGIEGSKWYPLRLFLEDWLCDVCEDNVTLVKRVDPEFFDPQYSLFFESSVDAVVVKLKDIPEQLSKYIKIS